MLGQLSKLRRFGSQQLEEPFVGSDEGDSLPGSADSSSDGGKSIRRVTYADPEQKDKRTAGQLRVKIVQATDLPVPMRRLNRQHPRAFLTYTDRHENEYRVRTPCVQRANSNPIWGTEYVFYHEHIGSAALVDTSFKLEVVHCHLDRHGDPIKDQHTPIGLGFLPLYSFLVPATYGKTSTTTCALFDNSTPAGQVHVEVAFMPDNRAADGALPEPEKEKQEVKSEEDEIGTKEAGSPPKKKHGGFLNRFLVAPVVSQSSSDTELPEVHATSMNTLASSTDQADKPQSIGDRLDAMNEATKFEGGLTEKELRLFRLYDKSKSGHLDEAEFKAMLMDLHDVGGNIDQLLYQGRKGCLGYFIIYPRMDLVTYIKTQHTLLFVIYGRGKPESYDWEVYDRVGLIFILVLWSLMASSLVKLEIPGLPAGWLLLVVAIVDSFGASFLRQFFFISHSRALPKVCRDVMKSLLVCVMVGCLAVTMLALPHDDLVQVMSLFLPTWFAARATEVFKVASLWSIKVQYGGGKGSLGLL